MPNATMKTSFQSLISMLVNENGKGHNELARRVDSGEVKEEEAVIVEVYAWLEKIERGLDRVLKKL